MSSMDKKVVSSISRFNLRGVIIIPVRIWSIILSIINAGSLRQNPAFTALAGNGSDNVYKDESV